MTPENLLRQLAERHEQHLRWLRWRLGPGASPDDVEDILQGAYARALTALRRADDAPAFADAGRAQAWLRTIALNLALDIERQRRGRPRDGRERRLAQSSLDADGLRALPDTRVHIEDDVLESLERDARRPLIAGAIGSLDPTHRQILQLRYGRDLEPAAIMVLEGLNRRQWEGRHTRAVKALGRALARLHVSSECGQTRRLLRRSPTDLLGRGRTPASDHVASCVACGAFARSAQYALATLPLPMAIAAW
nr:sigma-70 family RNA polymerase sigma factor [Solirubrobacterales bacterium]